MMNEALIGKTCIGLLLTTIDLVGVHIENSVICRWKSAREPCVWGGRWVTFLVIVAHGPLRLSGKRRAERNDWASQNGSKG